MHALLQNEHSSYLAAVGRTNNRLYELLGGVFAFGQTCFKNSTEFDRMLSEPDGYLFCSPDGEQVNREGGSLE